MGIAAAARAGAAVTMAAMVVVNGDRDGGGDGESDGGGDGIEQRQW